MNATHARTATRSVARAVQHAAQTARASESSSTAQNSVKSTRSVTATVLTESLGGPPDRLRNYIDDVEIEGDVYCREARQDLARARVEQSQHWARLRTLLADQPEARELALQCANEAGEAVIREFEHEMREVGWLLVTNGFADLWQLIYLRWRDGDLYVLGDEIRFLRKEASAEPMPLPEV